MPVGMTKCADLMAHAGPGCPIFFGTGGHEPGPVIDKPRAVDFPFLINE